MPEVKWNIIIARLAAVALGLTMVFMTNPSSSTPLLLNRAAPSGMTLLLVGAVGVGTDRARIVADGVAAACRAIDLGALGVPVIREINRGLLHGSSPWLDSCLCPPAGEMKIRHPISRHCEPACLLRLSATPENRRPRPQRPRPFSRSSRDISRASAIASRMPRSVNPITRPVVRFTAKPSAAPLTLRTRPSASER